MGGRKFRLSSRKNQERKKHATKRKLFPVSSETVNVHMPLSPLHDNTTVSLPRSIFTTSRVCSVKRLQSWVLAVGLPSSWVDVSKHDGDMSSLVLCKVEHQPTHTRAAVSFTLTVADDFKWSLGVTLQKLQLNVENCELLSATPKLLDSSSHIHQLLSLLNSSKICRGNSSAKYLRLMEHRAQTSVTNGKSNMCILYS